MKLSSNYNKVNILTSTMMLVLTGIIYYFFIHAILTDDLDKDLRVEEDEIRQYAATYQKLPLAADFLDQQVSYIEIKTDGHERTFGNTKFFNQTEGGYEPGRSLITTLKVGDKTYRVTIVKSRMEAEALMRMILFITLAVTVVLLVVLLLMNRIFFSRLWRPFYAILDKITSFEVSGAEGIYKEPTQIDEFIQLNAAVDAMVERVRTDYRELKSFTDNASHEMMTPLAIINMKLDSLLQTEGFTEQQSLLIEDIYAATGRLSRLHQSLLLLAKIENKLISDVRDIDFGDLVSGKIRQFQELLENDHLSMESNIGSKHVRMSRFLADILLNNLFGNAIRHNLQGGSIRVELSEDRFTISNAGKDMAIGLRLFDRFSKSPASEGMGLGLAISKQICNLYGFGLEYENKDQHHYFSILFN